MSITIKNLTNRPVLLRFNSGSNLYLGPNAIKTDVMEVEVKNNDSIKKLVDRSIILEQSTEKNVLASTRHKKQKTDSPKQKGNK
jgi:hypothetical protein